MFLSGRSRSAVFLRRTVFLLVPIPVSVGTLRSASHAGFGSLFSIPLSSEIYGSRFVSAAMLNHLFNQRNFEIPGVKNYGNTWLYYPHDEHIDDEHDVYDTSKVYTIENMQPFNLGQFGGDFSVTPIKIGDEPSLGTIKHVNNLTQSAPKTKELEIKRKLSTADKKPEVLEEYYLNKTDFERSIFREKGDLQLVVDLNIYFGEISGFAPTVVDLSQFIVENDAEIPLISVFPPSKGQGQGQQSEESTTFSLKVSKDSNENLNFSLIRKKENSTPPGSSPGLPNPDKVGVSIRHFFLMFSESPALAFEDMFNQTPQSSSSTYPTHQENRIRRIYLDTWTNKQNNTWGNSTHTRAKRAAAPSSQQESQFEFSNTTPFWRSLCSDVYKVGGFIDQKTPPASTGSSTPQSKKDSEPYVTQQKSLHEDFDPRQDRLVASKNTTLNPTLPYTTASPCSGMDDETKKLLEEYAQPVSGTNKPKSSMVNEPKSTIDWNLIPKPIKEAIDSTSHSTSKIIQGSFRAWGSGYAENSSAAKSQGMYDTLREEAIRTEHAFDIKIDKETIKSKLIDHAKLNKNEANASKKLNELKEISSSVQVSIPYSFSIYDPVANFLHKQRVNLSLSLDLRTIYNQSKSFKEFLSYDIGTNHAVIGTDYGGKPVHASSGTKYGLSGTISFGAGLYLDLDSNLRVQLITKTKGFVSTKKSVCDWRDRLYKSSPSSPQTCEGADTSSGWKYRKHNHLPPFIVLEINEDPKISSFYFDRRIGAADSTTTTPPSTQQQPSQPASASSGTGATKIETLSEFKDSLEDTKRTMKIVKQLDQSNNAEVYFAKLDVTDPSSKEQQNALQTKIGDDGQLSVVTEPGWLRSTYSWVSYYIPRRHYGEIFIDDDRNLDEVEVHIKGSSALGSSFFQSMHYGTKMTYCRSSNSSTNSSTNSSNECADGQKYEKIEKDQENKALDSAQAVTSVKVKFSELKSNATSSSSPKTFNFQTVIHRPANSTSGGDPYSFETSKEKMEFLFKESGGMSSTHTKKSQDLRSQAPDFSLVGVWYSLEMWYDANNKKICYYTKLRAISSVAGLGSKAKKDGTVANTETHKVPGASAKAGFELSKIEFSYKKTQVAQA